MAPSAHGDGGGPSRARVALGSGVQNVLRKTGFELGRYGPSLEAARRVKLLASREVTLVLDIGANAGQYAGELRDAGYPGRIVSFEPLSEAYGDLAAAADADPEWTARRLAVGATDGSSEINIAGNSGASSSLLEMEERHVESAPESAYVGTETVEVSRLDSIWDEVVAEGDRVFLKLDVQGYEMEVLRGAEASLPEVAGVQVELSLVPLYAGGADYHEVIEHLERNGFRLAGLEPGHDDVVTGEMLQADAIFIRV